MAELQLKVVKNTGDGIWGKALNNFNKVLYSSGGGFFNLVIGAKRNAVLRASESSANITKVANEHKRNLAIEKYEKTYENYLETLEKYIKETLYTRVQKKISTIKENKLLSKYYEMNALKGIEYCEYKYKRQILLLEMDFENILNTKSGYYLEKYEKFYINVVDQLYKSVMRHYAIKLTSTTEEKQATFDKIYDLIEGYIKLVLPYLKETEGRNKIIDTYKNYVEKIDLYSKREINSVKKEIYLLELGMNVFEYCLPTLAAEECYLNILAKARVLIQNTYIVADKFEIYCLLLDTIESYNYNVLSKKIVWDNELEKEEYINFWNTFNEYKKLERIDYNEYKRLREIHFVKQEVKKLKEKGAEYKDLRGYYRERMKQLRRTKKV